MSKFYNYINEVTLEDIDLSQFKEECYTALQDTKKNAYTFLYSGRRSSDTIIRKEVRKNRRPMDTPDEIHDLLNDEFKNKFGVKARSQSIFAVPEGDVTFYGEPFFLFPVGKKYMYIWSEHVKDLFAHIGDKVRKEYEISRNASMLSISRLIEDEGSFYIDMSDPMDYRMPRNPNSSIYNKSSKNIKEVTKEEYMDTIRKIVKGVAQLYEKSRTIRPLVKSQPVEVMVVADYVWLINKNKISAPEMKKWIYNNIR